MKGTSELRRREPNACINLTNAATFSEFAEEVRSDGWSDLQYSASRRVLKHPAKVTERYRSTALYFFH